MAHPQLPDSCRKSSRVWSASVPLKAAAPTVRPPEPSEFWVAEEWMGVAPRAALEVVLKMGVAPRVLIEFDSTVLEEVLETPAV